MLEWLLQWFPRGYRWACLCTLIGVLAAMLFLHFGFLKTMFIVLCALIGFFAGKLLDERSDGGRRYY
jgi:uncharacterized membrane protein